MSLLYRLDLSSSNLAIRLEEKNSRRILYLDTLKSLAKAEDQESIHLLTKIHLRSSRSSHSLDTLSFQRIEIGADQMLSVLQKISETKRLYYKTACLQSDWKNLAKIYWKGEEKGSICAVLQWMNHEVALSECDYVGQGWCLWKEQLFAFQSNVSWKWIERFIAEPLVLAGSEKKKFLDENPPILWAAKEQEKPLEILPELVFSDATGCFANLQMHYVGIGRIDFQDMSSVVGGRARQKQVEISWEKDLIETGFIKKTVGNSCYYCPGDKVKETLYFLLDLGWTIWDMSRRRVVRSGSVSFRVQEAGSKVAVTAEVPFLDCKMPLHSLLSLRSSWVDLGGGLVGFFDRTPFSSLEGDWEGDTLILSKAAFVSSSFFSEKVAVDWSENVRQMMQGMNFQEGIPEASLDSSFHGKLLPFQQKGVDFLSFLQKWGFSCLIADEMGLGKTVQVLAFFSRLKMQAPFLVVAPSSLLYQWRLEILRFLPHMSVYVHCGIDRRRCLQGIEGVILTSYTILRSDLDLFSSLEFDVIVLDEAQAIKTASTQTAKAARLLSGRFKIALTGTPIENSPEELVSQFQFLMPNLVSSASDLVSLKRKTKPFILRRRKRDVELQLPEKIEQIVWVEMNDEQKAVYQSYLSHFQSGLLKNVHKNGLSAHRMEVLEAILRLRQICVDPRLVGEAVMGAKLELLLSEIQDRKVLVFSQFTSMLQIVKKELKSQDRSFLYLDGATSQEERALNVRQFQEDESANIFLLSLKAGGVGLNLTAADYVILLDPWWNEAVENQAIDRAHRIGQKKTVIAKKYLVPNSIEEKMLRLKEKKTQTAELLLDDEASNWTEEDLLHLLS